MADYPTTPFTPRTKENRRGVVYDETKKNFLFAEDLTKIEDEIIEVEEHLTPGSGKMLPYGVGAGSADSAMMFYEFDMGTHKQPLMLPVDELGTPLSTLIGFNLQVMNPTGDPTISLTNGLTGVTSVFGVLNGRLVVNNGVTSLKEAADENTGIKEAMRLTGKLLGQATLGDKAGIVITDGAGEGLGANKKLAFLYAKINTMGEFWKGGLCLGIFKNAAINTPVEIIEIDGDGETEIKQKLNCVGELTCDSTIGTEEYYKCGENEGITEDFTNVVDVRMNGTTLEKKTQDISVVGGIVVSSSNISEWT